MHFTRRDQEYLKDMALEPTGSTGWMKDAVAFGASRDPLAPIFAVGVFQNFRSMEADFHFAMIEGARITPETVKGMISIAFMPRGFGLNRIWGHIKSGNTVAQAAAIKAGAEFEYRIRSSAEGSDDVIVMSMQRAGPPHALPGTT